MNTKTKESRSSTSECGGKISFGRFSERVVNARGITQNSTDPDLDMIRVSDGHNVSSPKADTDIRDGSLCLLQADERFALVEKLFRRLKESIVSSRTSKKSL
jgi:hypothetical protein